MQNKPHFFFFGNRGSQKGGGGGVRHLEKIPKKSRFFLGVASLSNQCCLSNSYEWIRWLNKMWQMRALARWRSSSQPKKRSPAPIISILTHFHFHAFLFLLLLILAWYVANMYRHILLSLPNQELKFEEGIVQIWSNIQLLLFGRRKKCNVLLLY